VGTDVFALRGVWKRYGDRDVLRDVGFSVGAGESVGYLGPNGAGKTTTLKLLAGISRPSRGTVEIHGVDPLQDRARALGTVGALVETPGIPPYLHGRDLLEYIARTQGIGAPERRAAVTRAAEATGVAEHLDRPFGSLSTGLGRRMLLSAALVGEPQALILDEPTLGLDPAARHDLRELLRQLSREGLTVLLSTHLLEDVERVCRRVLFLRDGELVGDEPVERAPEGAAGTRRRVLDLGFGAEVAAATLAAVLGPEVEVTVEGARRARAAFTGDDRTQAELLNRVVRASLPLISAAVPESDLGRRYLERVGREGET
jgi:ABC-type multidrug transport system ATPase subunit